MPLVGAATGDTVAAGTKVAATAEDEPGAKLGSQPEAGA